MNLTEVGEQSPYDTTRPSAGYNQHLLHQPQHIFIMRLKERKYHVSAKVYRHYQAAKHERTKVNQENLICELVRFPMTTAHETGDKTIL
jgi:hypothetical protein